MAEKPVYRIELSPSAFAIIEAEAYLTGKTLKALASEMVEKHCSQNAIKFAKLKEGTVEKPKDLSAISVEASDGVSTMRDERPERLKVQKAECGDPNASDGTSGSTKPKRRDLINDADANAKIVALWQGGEHRRSKIAKVIGYSKSTVGDHITRLIRDGVLVDDRGEPSQVPQPTGGDTEV